MHDRIPASLAGVRANLAALLRWPDNIGIQFRALHGEQFLCVFAEGLAAAEHVSDWVVTPLQQSGAAALSDLADLLPAPALRIVGDLRAAVEGIMGGDTAVFVEGAAGAVLVDTTGYATRRQGSRAVDARQEVFGTNLRENVALLRKRLRDPALVARPLPLPPNRGAVAVVYLDGVAPDGLIADLSRRFAETGGEGWARRGSPTGTLGKLGLVPELLPEEWPDKVAYLLHHGYAAVLVDRMTYAYVAPVTASALLHAPGDETLVQRVVRFLKAWRLALIGIVVLLPAFMVAVLSFHQEMIPTPFLLVVAASRESRPFPIGFEMILVSLIQELVREAAVRLPVSVQVGQALIADLLILGLLLFSGYVGPTVAAVTVVVAVASIGVSGPNLLYPCRIWRLLLVIPASFLGAYGLAIAAFLLATYLMGARSYGTAFLGEPGIHLTPLKREP